MILSGRGWGKTRTGAEWLVWQAISQSKTRWAVVARTAADIRDTCFEGESGLISVIKRYGVYDVESHNKSTNSYIFPNGSIIKGYSAEQPDSLRGPQHHGAWVDELAAWSYDDTWNQLQFGLRLGDNPRTVITTTPRPNSLIRDLIKRETTFVTRGNTFENAKNLADSALQELQARYAGTRLGRQELFGEVLDDVDGALWNRTMIESTRIEPKDLPPLIRVVVAIDPAVTSGENSDYTGIVTAGMTADGHYYVLADNTLKDTPDNWAREAVKAYNLHKADRIIAETNNGGDMVTLLLRQVEPNIPTKKVTATRGKRVRAEPISALYEQKRVHHVGMFDKLEDQMVSWTPDLNESPDRLDALVWALTELTESSATMLAFAQMADFCPSCRFPTSKGAVICLNCNQPMNNGVKLGGLI